MDTSFGQNIVVLLLQCKHKILVSVCDKSRLIPGRFNGNYQMEKSAFLRAFLTRRVNPGREQ